MDAWTDRQIDIVSVSGWIDRDRYIYVTVVKKRWP